MEIRIAAETDAVALLGIYAQYIDTAITFEYELPTAAEFAQRIVETQRYYPYLVACEEGRICGYAYAHRFQARDAYQWGAELSVYLDSRMLSRGVGFRLYRLLIELLKLQGVRTVYGCVTSPNPRSERLHERLGFRSVGVFRRAGFKNGEWHDVVWFEKELGAYDQPAPLRSFAQLPPAVVTALFHNDNLFQ